MDQSALRTEREKQLPNIKEVKEQTKISPMRSTNRQIENQRKLQFSQIRLPQMRSRIGGDLENQQEVVKKNQITLKFLQGDISTLQSKRGDSMDMLEQMNSSQLKVSLSKSDIRINKVQFNQSTGYVMDDSTQISKSQLRAGSILRGNIEALIQRAAKRRDHAQTSMNTYEGEFSQQGTIQNISQLENYKLSSNENLYDKGQLKNFYSSAYSPRNDKEIKIADESQPSMLWKANNDESNTNQNQNLAKVFSGVDLDKNANYKTMVPITKRPSRLSLIKSKSPNKKNQDQYEVPKSVFPLKKYEVVKPVETANGIQIRKQIDQVINSKIDQPYDFDQSSFRQIQKALNFEQRLEHIDSIMQKELIQGTTESITPAYVYKLDPLNFGKIRKIKLNKINDSQYRDQLKKIKYSTDHKGRIVTMNGSQYDNFKHMVEMNQIREQSVKKTRQPKTIMNGTTSFQGGGSKDSRSQSNTLKKYNRNAQDQNPYITFDPLRKQETVNFQSFNNIQIEDQKSKFSFYSLKKKAPTTLNQTFADHLSGVLRSKVAQQDFTQESQQKIIAKFRRALLKKLNCDEENDLIEELKKNQEDAPQSEVSQVIASKALISQTNNTTFTSSFMQAQRPRIENLLHNVSDEIIEKRLASSQYDQEFQNAVNKAKNHEQEIMIKRQLKDQEKNDSPQKTNQIEQGANDIKNKLNFFTEISKARNVIDKFLQKKEVKRWKIENIDQTRLQKVFTEVKQDLNKMQDLLQTQSLESDENDEYDESNPMTLEQATQYFLQECAKNKVQPPLLYKKIENRRITFSNEQMTIDVCRVLSKSLRKFCPEQVDEFVFDTINFDEESVNVLIQGISSLKRVKVLHFTNNFMPENAVRNLVKLFNNSYPNQIEELVLDGTYLGFALLGSFIQGIQGKCQLRNLGLAKQEFDSKGLKYLAKLVKQCTYLEFLDLSFGRFYEQEGLSNFLNNISGENNNLKYLNISFNPMQKSNIEAFAQAIYSFTSSSKSLVHLNLSACALNDQQILRKIFKGVRKSKTIQSIHFSGNQIKSQQALQAIRDTLGVYLIDRRESHTGGLYTEFKDSGLNFQTPEMSRTNSINNSPRENNGNINHQSFKKADKLFEIHKEEKLIESGDLYFFTRVLGHLEIQNGHRWVERDQCWICNQWNYFVLIWSESLGDNLYQIKPSKDFLEKCDPAIHNHDQITEPILKLSTENKPRLMLHMSEFIDRLEKNLKPHTRIVLKVDEKKRLQELEAGKSTKIQQKFNLIKNITKSLSLQKKMANTYRLKNLQKLQDQDEWKDNFKLNKEWPHTIERLIEAKQENSMAFSVSHINQLKIKPDEIYFAFADYMPPLRYPVDFQVFFGQTRPKQVFSFQTPIQPRQSRIDLKNKRTKKTRADRQFNLKQSVFNQWTMKIDEEYKKYFEADMKYSKIKKFIKEGTPSYRDICNCILKNYGKIFEVYLYCSGRSNYPSIQWIDFTDMCMGPWHLVDKNLTLSTIDRLFIAVNFEGVPGGLDDNPDKELCRYEFFEILVRMAIAKFPQMTAHDALQLMLDDYILTDPNLVSWWNFRLELMWTLEVDDLFKANQHLSKKLFESVQTLMKKQYTRDDAIAMVEKCGAGLKLNEKEITMAFAYSKFPVIDEMIDIAKLDILNFGEFQEFIARLAQVKYMDPQMTLYDKIFKVMTELFKLIGASPLHPLTDDLGESESDYDEFVDPPVNIWDILKKKEQETNAAKFKGVIEMVMQLKQLQDQKKDLQP